MPICPPAISLPVAAPRHTVSEVVKKCLEAKEAAGHRPKYITSLKQYYAALNRVYGSRAFNSITVEDLEA